MNALTIAWVALPFLLGFSIYLLPRLARVLSCTIALLSLGYSFACLLAPESLTIKLLDHFSVTLIIDSLSGYFILTNALVTLAVLFYCWQEQRSAFFYTQMTILHGSVNAIFICADFISVYVALEVISIAAFLLIAYPRSDRAIWVGLRYLFISNTAMLFYLVGAVLVYKANHSFAFAGLAHAPPEAIALIGLGLLTKGGIFISGLWLPLTHSESATPISALLSGVVIKAGIFPLLRAALLTEDLTPLLSLFGIGTAFLGVIGAIAAQDTKRLLAFSTISQLGFVLVAPGAAGFYALTHGLAKASLFLIAGNLPSRQLTALQQQGVPQSLRVPLAIAALSISGCPLLAGFAAKSLTLKALLPWQANLLTLATVGTAIVFAKLLFLPLARAESKPLRWGLLTALGLLAGGIVTLNFWMFDRYMLPELSKAILVLGAGWLLYWGLIRHRIWQISRTLEQLEHLIGMMSIMLVVLFWFVVV
ncbi:MAG: cation:proton antiporter [Cyanobacteria bacterium P01_G01_bin.54]